MPSSTSSSEIRTPIAQSEIEISILPPERPIPAIRMGTAGITAFIFFVLSLGGWEYYWRASGSVPSYRNSEGLWAQQRRRIDSGEGNATVLIGSSRMLSNVQLHVWERLEGRRPIQLSLEGTSPLRALKGLADDPNFTGRLLVGVAPGLFFSGYGFRGEVFDYYEKETPAQRWGQQLSMQLVEPYFAFYDPDFALFALLKRQNWPNRQGVPNRKDVRKLFVSEADRNMHLWSKVEHDPEYQALAKNIWAQTFRPLDEKAMIEAAKIRHKQIEEMVAAVNKLKARGVEVIFVLHPVEGDFYEYELKKTNPRGETWDVLLARTGVRGVHFEDYPELQKHWLPEWSHLATADAEKYTEALYRIIELKSPGTNAPQKDRIN